MDWLEQAVHLTIILTFLGGLFAKFIMHPLNETLKGLKEAINGLKETQNMQNTRLNRLESAMERIEKAVITAHARIDRLLQEGGERIELGHR